MLRPRLKPVNCVADGETLILSLDPRERIELADPTGHVRALLLVLGEAASTAPTSSAPPSGSTGTTSTGPSSMRRSRCSTVSAGWRTPPHLRRLTDYERERYFSNLAFFDAFTTLERGREEIQQRLIDSHVVVLGAGGLGSAVVQNLAGLGVSSLTLLDFDLRRAQELRAPVHLHRGAVRSAEGRAGGRVAPGLRLAHRRDGGERPSRRPGRRPCAACRARTSSVAAIDDPDDVDLWVNEACVGAGVPFIRGGLAYVQGLYWSVDPGRSACRHCLELYRATLAQDVDRAVATGELVLRGARVNRAIGPVAQLLGSLVAMEAVRYLTGITAPVSAGCYQLVDFPAAARSRPIPGRATPTAPSAPPRLGAGRGRRRICRRPRPVGA